MGIHHGTDGHTESGLGRTNNRGWHKDQVG
jgi:hypothetical protein